MVQILVADDDAGLRDIVRFALEREGWRVTEAADGTQALAQVRRAPPDLVVLDVMMPGLDGVAVCREVRKLGDLPIVFLSARDEEIDRVIGLEVGGDDYVTKPFSPRELVARIKAVLRRLGAARAAAPAAAPETLTIGRLVLDLGAHTATWAGEPVVLTVTEFGILTSLAARPGLVLSRDQLMDRAYPIDKQVADRTIDSHVRRVRRKFADRGARVIETVHGVGYKLGPC